MPVHAKINSVVDVEAQVLENLSIKLQNISKEQRRWESTAFRNSKDDACTQYLHGKISDIDRLSREVFAFENPGQHFTKSYRILEGSGSKLYTDLDKIDTFARDNLREKRKKAYQDIEDLLKVLAGKAHPSGRPCSQCEVQQ